MLVSFTRPRNRLQNFWDPVALAPRSDSASKLISLLSILAGVGVDLRARGIQPRARAATSTPIFGALCVTEDSSYVNVLSLIV